METNLYGGNGRQQKSERAGEQEIKRERESFWNKINYLMNKIKPKNEYFANVAVGKINEYNKFNRKYAMHKRQKIETNRRWLWIWELAHYLFQMWILFYNYNFKWNFWLFGFSNKQFFYLLCSIRFENSRIQWTM